MPGARPTCRQRGGHEPPCAQPSPWLSQDRKSTRLNSSHLGISYAVFCLKKKKHKKDSSNRRPISAGDRGLPVNNRLAATKLDAGGHTSRPNRQRRRRQPHL